MAENYDSILSSKSLDELTDAMRKGCKFLTDVFPERLATMIENHLTGLVSTEDLFTEYIHFQSMKIMVFDKMVKIRYDKVDEKYPDSESSAVNTDVKERLNGILKEAAEKYNQLTNLVLTKEGNNLNKYAADGISYDDLTNMISVTGYQTLKELFSE